jgi:hypothetical protein
MLTLELDRQSQPLFIPPQLAAYECVVPETDRQRPRFWRKVGTVQKLLWKETNQNNPLRERSGVWRATIPDKSQ